MRENVKRCRCKVFSACLSGFYNFFEINNGIQKIRKE
jgi:hypothetical protein